MPNTLYLGPLSIDVDQNYLASWDWSDNKATLSFVIADTTLAAAKAKRDEIKQLRTLDHIAVRSDLDDSQDGFYRVTAASARQSAEEGSLRDGGWFRMTVTMEFIGPLSTVLFRSEIAPGVCLENDKALTSANVDYVWSPPVGALAVRGGETSVYGRDTEAGEITVVYLDRTTNPTWKCAPADYYAGACQITIDSVLRVGDTYPNNSPIGWVMENATMRVRPSTTASASDGKIIVGGWDGTTYQEKTYGFYYDGTTLVSEWHYMQVLWNTPAVTIVRLVRDADEANPSSAGHELTLLLRRGSRVVDWIYKYSAETADWAVELITAESAETVTPGIATDAVAIRASSNDANGDRFVLGSSMDFTTDLVQGGIAFSGVRNYRGFFGMEIDGSSAVQPDRATDLCLQHMANYGLEIVQTTV